MKSIKPITSSVFLLALVLMSVAQFTLASPTAPASGDEERLPIGADGSLFLAGTECGPNEELAPGSLLTCEPTCENPRPACPKVFFSSVDYVPCFCKAPLVRNIETKLCVQLSECPKT